jgi:hypothetical protein
LYKGALQPADKRPGIRLELVFSYLRRGEEKMGRFNLFFGAVKTHTASDRKAAEDAMIRVRCGGTWIEEGATDAFIVCASPTAKSYRKAARGY